MKKNIGVLILSLFILLSIKHASIAQTNNTVGNYDSLAISNINALVQHYTDLSNNLFNTAYNDSLRVAFNNLFKEDALLFRDYTTEKAALSPEEYVYYLNNYFGDNKPICTIPAGIEIADLKFISSGSYYVAKVKLNKQISFRYNKESQTLDNTPANFLLQMEVLVTENLRGTRFLGIRDISPIAPVDLAVVETKVKEKADKPIKEKAVKPVKEQVEKPEKVKIEKTPSTNDNLIFLNWSIGNNLALGKINSESSIYKISDFSYLGWQVGLSGLKGISESVYVGLGLGFHFGTVKLGYENAAYSIEFDDQLNALVDTYTRNAFITDIEETIKFTNLNIQALIYLDLLKSDNNKLLVGSGLSLGFGINEISEVNATTKYTGTFHTIDGQTFPEPFTIGNTSPVPVYGFETSNFDQEFDLASKMTISLPVNLKAIHTFKNNIFMGAGIEGLIPLSAWLEGTSTHQNIFTTQNDLNTSLASTVSKAKRPLYIGLGITIGIQF